MKVGRLEVRNPLVPGARPLSVFLYPTLNLLQPKFNFCFYISVLRLERNLSVRLKIENFSSFSRKKNRLAAINNVRGIAFFLFIVS